MGKWRHYHIGQDFVIHTDYQSKKTMLNKTILTPEQQKFFYKLLGFNYTIKYKPEKERKVVDALSRQFKNDEGSSLSLSLSYTLNQLISEINKEQDLRDELIAKKTLN